MKSGKIALALLVGIFLIAAVNAVSVSWGEWSNGSASLTITQGQNASFNYYFYSTSSQMSVSAKLYNFTSGKLIHTFFDTGSSSYYYNSQPVAITPQIYKSPGKYSLTFYSNDASNSPSIQTIYLTVNPSPLPPNTPPTLAKITNQAVNENSLYSYQVSASDSDGDTLTYSLVSAPSWISINPSTGLISGTSPSVSSDKNYQVEVGVSDGVNPQVTTGYVLTVKNVPLPPTPDTIPPAIILNSPSNNILTNHSAVTFSGRVSDNVAVANVSYLINGAIKGTDSSGKNNSNYLFTATLSDGTYSWSYEACDNSGNCATSHARTITIDATSPKVSFTNLTTSSGGHSQKFIYVGLAASDSGSGIKNTEFSLYNSTGTVEVYSSLSSLLAMNVTNLADGTYYLNATAEDNAGNVNSTATRTIILDTVSPSVGFVSPTPSNNQKLNQSFIPVKVTASDPSPGTGVKNVTVYLYSSSSLLKSQTSASSSESVNFTGLSDGTYYLNATAYDRAGNLRSTGTIKIILATSGQNNGQTGQPTYLSSDYSYNDVYTQQYQEQLNHTSPGISLSETASGSPLATTFWIWLLLVAILVLLTVGVIFFLARTNKKEKKQ